MNFPIPMAYDFLLNKLLRELDRLVETKILRNIIIQLFWDHTKFPMVIGQCVADYLVPTTATGEADLDAVEWLPAVVVAMISVC